MINVLLNYYNFDGDWAYERLQPYVKGHMLIVPLAYREHDIYDEQTWQSVYGVGGTKYDNIMRPFARFGIDNADIDWLDYYDSKDKLAQIASADVLFFTGGMPEKAIVRLAELNLTDAVKHFDGVVMGASAGAMLQLSRYHVTPDEDYDSYGLWNGLGLVHGFDLEVHFLATELQRQCTARAARELGVPIYQMWHEGGLIVCDGKVTPMGSVCVVKP